MHIHHSPDALQAIGEGVGVYRREIRTVGRAALVRGLLVAGMFSRVVSGGLRHRPLLCRDEHAQPIAQILISQVFFQERSDSVAKITARLLLTYVLFRHLFLPAE